MSVDPLAEEYPGWSPYNYTLNNPLVFVDPDGRSVENAGCEDPPCGKNLEYEIFNIAPVSDRLFLETDLEKETFDVMTGYGIDNFDNHFKMKEDALKEALKGTMSVASDAWGLNKILITSGFSKLSVAGIGASFINVEEDGLAGLYGVSSIFKPFTDQIRLEGAAIDNMIKWDNVLTNLNSLMSTKDLNDVILIYSNENLFQKSTLDLNEARILNHKKSSGDFKHLYYGTQYGKTLYIYGKYSLK